MLQNSGNIAFHPLGKGLHVHREFRTEWSETVFHLWRLGGVDLAQDEAVGLQSVE